MEEKHSCKVGGKFRELVRILEINWLVSFIAKTKKTTSSNVTMWAVFSYNFK